MQRAIHKTYTVRASTAGVWRTLLMCTFIAAVGVTAASAQDDEMRGRKAGNTACQKGSFTTAPNTAGHSPEFVLGWQMGCNGALSSYHHERGFDTGKARCASDPTAISPEPRDREFTMSFVMGCFAAAIVDGPCLISLRERDVLTFNSDCFNNAAFGKARAQFDDLESGYQAGNTACQKGSFTTAPNTAGHSREFVLGWQRGCSAALFYYHFQRGSDTGNARCASDPTVISPEPRDRNFTLGFASGCLYARRLRPSPPPPPAQPRPPDPPPGGAVIDGVNCASDDVPNYVKRQAGCPGFGQPVVQPPSQAPTPPSATPPASGGVVNGVNCASDDVPNYVKRQAGCPGFGPPAAPPQPPTQAPVPGRPSGGTEIGVSLTLRFTDARPIGGFVGHVVVPAEAARQYRHNGPIPQGSISGGAWPIGPNLVSLNTTRDSRLMSGRRYIVFLMFAGESVPVAILDLPPIDTDYAATLDATTDGASVLARAGV